MSNQKWELQRECKRVNLELEAEAEKLGLGTKRSLERLDTARQQEDMVALSHWSQLEFREICRRALEKHPAIQAHLLINDGARLLQLSPITIKRHLAVLCSRNGPFFKMGDIVMVSPHYKHVAKDDYWRDEEVSNGKE